VAFDDYEAHDALGLAELVRRGDVKPAELLEAALSRLEARNPALRAVVIPMLDEARAALDAGPPGGADAPLRGVPFLLKDLYALFAGTRTTNGCRLFAGQVADHDSTLVARYRRAGLVIFGKTHSPEFGLTTTTESQLFGATHNPWSRARTAGGSSGGAAAAVAAGIVPAAHASDGGGSIRVPASCCGLYGLKPTRARNPSGPDAGEGWSGMSTAHAITRSVRDSAALLDLGCGPEPGDPYWAPPPARPFLREVGAPPGALRVALQTETWNGAPTHPDCRAAAEDAARLLESLGHRVEPARLEIGGDALAEAARVIVAANLRFALEERARDLGRDFADLGEADTEPITLAMAQGAARIAAAEYARAVRTLHGLGRRAARFFEGRDVLLTPTLAVPPPPLGPGSLSNPDVGEFVRTLRACTGYTQLWNATGNPAASLPLAWNAEGLPIGVQIVGRVGDEATLLRLSAQLEAARPWFDRRPPPPRAEGGAP
jgi:Asp-tRNA(Asn)/Glu-tRNA(Gln) amidotransferase A subunit family amidase